MCGHVELNFSIQLQALFAIGLDSALVGHRLMTTNKRDLVRLSKSKRIGNGKLPASHFFIFIKPWPQTKRAKVSDDQEWNDSALDRLMTTTKRARGI